jgi:hypothetical protein
MTSPTPQRSWWSRYYRAVIYTLIFLCVLGPTFMRVDLPLQRTAATEGVYEAVQSIPAQRRAKVAVIKSHLADARSAQDTGQVARLEVELARAQAHSNGVLILSIDFGPGTAPELEPMTVAILRHAFSNEISVLGLCNGNPIDVHTGARIMAQCANETLGLYPVKKDGHAFVFLGYRPGRLPLLLAIGESIEEAFGSDNAGVAISELPFMQSVDTYDDVELVITITGYVGVPETWLAAAKTRYNKTLAFGLTAVSVADYYPYIQSDQIVGLLAGLRGAAEYEQAIGVPASACQRMLAQLFAHVLVAILVLIGNVEFIVRRRRGTRNRI